MSEVRPDGVLSVLVTGATGMQGGKVAEGLRRAGMSVTALVRDPSSERARALERQGHRLVVGDLEDPDALESACSGHTTLFSMQPAPLRDPDSERRQAGLLFSAARRARVHHLVHSSVSGTGWRERYPDVDPGALRNYWDSKEAVEELARRAGFPAWTIVKPAFFMENFVEPKSSLMFPLLADGELLVATAPSTEVGLVAADDFAAAVAVAAADPERYHRAEVELGSDARTFPEIADVISQVTGHPVKATCGDAADVDQRLGRRSWSASQSWLDDVGYPARSEHARAVGLDMPTGFRQWAAMHRDELLTACGVDAPD